VDVVLADTPTLAEGAADQTRFRVYDNDKLVGIFEDRADASVAAKAAADPLIYRFEGERNMGFDADSRFVNRHQDALHSIKKLDQVARKQSGADAVGHQRTSSYAFAKMTQNAAEVARTATAAENGAQFRWVPDQGVFSVIDGSKGLGQILKPLSKEDPTLPRLLGAYMHAKRIMQIDAGRGRTARIDMGITPKQFLDYSTLIRSVEGNQKLMSKLTPVLSDMEQFNNNHLDLMVDLGVYSPEMRNTVAAANELYLPFHRILENTDTSLSGAGRDTTRKAVKGMEAGEDNARFSDPLRNYAANIEAATQAAIHNQRLAKIGNQINNLPEDLRPLFGQVVEYAPKPKEELDAINARLNAANISKADKARMVDVINQQSATGQRNTTVFDLFQQGKQLKDGVIPFYDQGVKKYLKVENPDLLESLQTFTRVYEKPEGWRRAFDIMGDVSSIFQYIVTRMPDFVVGTSLFTDPVSAAAYSNSRKVRDFVPGVGAVGRLGRGAIMQLQADKKLFHEAVANGVLYSGLSSVSSRASGRTARWLTKNGFETDRIFGMSAEQDSRMTQKIILAAREALARTKHGVDIIPEFIDASPRLGELQIQMKQQNDKALAYLAALDNNIDFRRSGASAWSQLLFRAAPFSKAGNNILARLWQSRDLRGGNFYEGAAAGSARAKDNAIRQVKILTTVGLPAIGLSMWYADDPRYQDLRPEDRKLFYHFWIGDDPVPYRIRKTDDLAQMANIVDNVLGLFRREDITGYEALRSSVLDMAVEQLPGGLRTPGDIRDTLTNYLPMGVKQLVNYALNNSFGTGEIMPKDLDQLSESQEKYREGVTSNLARTISPYIPGSNPIMVDYFARDLTGPGWTVAAQAYDQTRPEAIDRGTEDMHVVRRFRPDVIQSMRRSNFGQTFYEIKQAADAAHAQVQSLQTRGRTGSMDTARLPNVNERMRTLIGVKPYMDQAARQIASMRAELRVMHNDIGRYSTNGVLTEEGRRRRQEDIDNATINIYEVQRTAAEYAARAIGNNQY
jgi:hypothetical protein